MSDLMKIDVNKNINNYNFLFLDFTMSVLNSKSGFNRLFPFAKKKPNIPSDKIDSKTNKTKLIEDIICPVIKSTESFRCDVLTTNNEKAKHVQEIAYITEVPKKNVLEIRTAIESQNNTEIDSKSNKSITRKSSNVSEVTIDDIKKPKENYQRWNIPFSSKFKGKAFDKTLLTMQDLIYYNPVTNPIVKEPKVEQREEDDPDNDLLPIDSVRKIIFQFNKIIMLIVLF